MRISHAVVVALASVAALVAVAPTPRALARPRAPRAPAAAMAPVAPVGPVAPVAIQDDGPGEILVVPHVVVVDAGAARRWVSVLGTAAEGATLGGRIEVDVAAVGPWVGGVAASYTEARGEERGDYRAVMFGGVAVGSGPLQLRAAVGVGVVLERDAMSGTRTTAALATEASLLIARRIDDDWALAAGLVGSASEGERQVQVAAGLRRAL